LEAHGEVTGTGPGAAPGAGPRPTPRARFRGHGRALAALLGGIAAEALVFVLLDQAEFGDVLGLPGVAGVTIAVVAALYAGPVVGAIVAAAGWGVFFGTLAEADVETLVVLPLWVATAILVGVVAGRQRALERRRADTMIEDIASHEFRTPVATIHGMAEALRGQPNLSEETRDHILELIAEESKRLLDEELLARERRQRRGR
jgi:signal transduction histidine kinase